MTIKRFDEVKIREEVVSVWIDSVRYVGTRIWEDTFRSQHGHTFKLSPDHSVSKS